MCIDPHLGLMQGYTGDGKITTVACYVFLGSEIRRCNSASIQDVVLRLYFLPTGVFYFFFEGEEEGSGGGGGEGG